MRCRKWCVPLLLALAAGCGGGGGDQPDSRKFESGIKLQVIDFNCDFVDRQTVNQSSYTVASATTTTVCIDGFIEATVPAIAWSNSAGGSGQALPQKVNCKCGPNSCCQLVWGVDNIALKPGNNALTFTATYNGLSDSVGLTITAAPSVVSTTPFQNASGVAPNTTISATFSDDMNPATVTTGSFQVKNAFSGNLVNGTVSYQSRIATFTPNPPLDAPTRYHAIVTSAATSTNGIGIAPVSWSFETATPPSDTTPPSVVSTSPTNGSSCTDIDSRLAATFNENIETATVTSSNFTLKDAAQNPVSGSVAAQTTTAVFAPLSSLSFSTTYTAALGSRIQDLAGNATTTSFTWSFTTPPDGIGAWQAISQSGSFVGDAVVWTGSEMIVWGTIFSNAGARYQPSTNTWSPMSAIGAPLRRMDPFAAWTGTEMIIWGGRNPTETGGPADGAIYNPSSDTWRPMSAVGSINRRPMLGVWTGSEVINFDLFGGARYNPATDSWQQIRITGAPPAAMGYKVVSAGTSMVIWGSAGGGIYSP